MSDIIHRSRRGRAVAVTAACALASTSALGIGIASPALAATLGSTSSKPVRVIVLLKDQYRGTPATGAHLAARRNLVRSDQTRVRSDLLQLGGTVTHAYTTLNALSVTVPESRLALLRSDPQVSAVVPDLTWTLPAAATHPKATAAVKDPRDVAPASTSICPADPSKPMLEPESLQTTHTDSDDPSAKTARSLGYTGAGVKVAYIAEGIDPNNQDFIRADGSHVFSDYEDFSGDGPNAETGGGEAFLDASSIAAQGLHSYDLSTFVNAAHPLPTGCNIRIEGISPGVSLVGLKVFSSQAGVISAPTSAIVQAIDYAVNTSHVNVLNESFGSNPYPDTGADPISLINQDAIDAGVTVVASTGDAGPGGTVGTAATDLNVISAGADTTFRSHAQTTEAGFQLSNGTWANGQLSALSSGGISQTGRVPDLLAPGDLGWIVCSDQVNADGNQQYGNCINYNGFKPSPFTEQGGTSMSAPLTAGAAALVIQAYRQGHDGTSPSPRVVRQILDSTADDAGLPSDEQGAGELNTYRAVQLAAVYGNAAPSGTQVTTDQQQVDVTANSGTSVTKQVVVKNQGATLQHFTAKLRAITSVIGHTTTTVSLDPATSTTTFVDGYGSTRAYTKVAFAVPAGTDRLVASISFPGDAGPLGRFALLDPAGTYTAYSEPQGAGNVGQATVHQAAPGTWTAILFTSGSASGVTAPITLSTTDYADSSAGTVSPVSFTLPVGGSQTVTTTYTAPQQESEASSLVLTGAFGQTTVVPVVTRAVQRVSPGAATAFNGTFRIGNGRDFGPAQTDTYLFAVPAGAKSLDIALKLAGKPANQVVAHLSDPSGEPVSTTLNVHPTDADGDLASDSGLQIVHANPAAGRWQLTVELLNPVSGAQLPQAFSGTASLNGAFATVTGVPNTRNAVRNSGQRYAATVTVHNTSLQAQTYYIDPRTIGRATFALVPVAPTKTPGTITLPETDSTQVPAWLVPTQATKLTVGASSSRPIAMDILADDNPTALNPPSSPDIEATSSGNTATAVHTAPEVTSALWQAYPTFVGPLNGSETGVVSAQASVVARGFAREWFTGTRDAMLATVDAQAPTISPVTIPAGKSATIHVTLYNTTAAKRSIVSGTLFLNTLSPFGTAGLSGLGDEVAAIPYGYTVGPVPRGVPATSR